MTKDGRPSPLYDTRLFNGLRGGYLEGHEQAWAFARRLTWWLNGEGFSIGHNPALYVMYTADLPVGAVEAEPPRFTRDDWWFRRVAIGVPPGFPGDDADSVAGQGLVTCMKALRPASSDLIDEAARIVTAAGDACRFLLKVRDTAKQIIEISTTIGVWREPSLFYVAITDKDTGLYREAPAVGLQTYDDGVYLAGKVKIARRGVKIAPRTSTMARLVVESNPSAATWGADEFTEARRPVISSLLKFR